MPNCAVAECHNHNKKTKYSDIKYFSFPKNGETAKQWIVACRREDKINVMNACVCSIHFEKESFEIPLKYRLLQHCPKTQRTLKPDAIPTLNLPGKRKRSEQDVQRAARVTKRRRREEVADILKDSNVGATNTDTIRVVTSPNGTQSSQDGIVDVAVEPLKGKVDEDEVTVLKQKIADLEEENAKLHLNVNDKEVKLKNMEHMLRKIFTPGQIRKIFGGGQTNIKWTPDDIASAISLRSVSPKAYRYLRTKNYPLPALSTLRNWASKFPVRPGVLKNVINLMMRKASELKEAERLCVLAFDEVYLSNRMDIDKKNEQKIGPCKTSQTVIARGLIGHWKQPVYFQFDQPMTADIINEIITDLYEANFPVIAIVSDMGTSNVKLWSVLNVAYNSNCCFQHPCDKSLNIYVIADPPHLLKLARNHLLDSGFNVNGNIINYKAMFEQLLSVSITDLTYAHKLTDYHLSLKGSERQRVRPAAQVLSNTVSQALQYCGERGLVEGCWSEAASTVKLFNDWFDLLNSRSKFTHNCPGKNAYGTNLQDQNNVLDQMSIFIKSMTVGKHKSLLPFQKGILLTNRSLKEMFIYLHSKYKVDYILTFRMNQDVVENFFSYIRGMGGSNDHPSPLDFQFRMRWFILGKNSESIFTANQNTISTTEKCFLNTEDCVIENQDFEDDVCLTKQMFSNVGVNVHPSSEKLVEEDLTTFSFVEPAYVEMDLPDSEIASEHCDLLKSFEVKEQTNADLLKYIAGYVAYRFKNKYNLGTETSKIDIGKIPDWLHFVSRGNLLQPNDELLQVTKVLDSEFYEMHGNTLSDETKIFQKLAKRTADKLQTDIPFEVLLCLSRTRTYIRLRNLNRKISFNNCKRKMKNKLTKFTT